MVESLVVNLDPDADQAQWIAVDDTGGRIGPPVSGPLSAARIDRGDRRLIVLVPATEVLTTAIDMPVKSSARIQQALPFALEEYVAEDIEELHCAAGARTDDGRLNVAVVSRSNLEAWLDKLSDAGLTPDAIIPENHGLPLVPGTASLLFDRDRVFINDGAEVSLVLQDLGPGEALQAIGAMEPLDAADGDADDGKGDEADGATAAPRHVLVYCDAENEARYSQELNLLRHDFESLDVKILPDGSLPRLAVTAGAGAGVNLLQGEYGPRTEYGSYLRPWRYAAMLLLALGVVGLAGQAIATLKLRSQASDLEARFIAEYQEIAPGTAEVRDPAAVIASLRARTGTAAPGGASSVFLESLVEFGEAVAGNESAKIQAINYRAGVVDILMSTPSVSVLDDIRSSVNESGRFQANIQSTDQDGDAVKSRLQIREAGS